MGGGREEEIFPGAGKVKLHYCCELGKGKSKAPSLTTRCGGLGLKPQARLPQPDTISLHHPVPFRSHRCKNDTGYELRTGLAVF